MSLRIGCLRSIFLVLAFGAFVWASVHGMLLVAIVLGVIAVGCRAFLLGKGKPS